jgi:hypothetical protein
MSISQANTLTTGSAIFYKNLINLKNYAASVSSITPRGTLTVAAPNAPGTPLSFPLSGDGTCEIPVYPLN